MLLLIVFFAVSISSIRGSEESGNSVFEPFVDFGKNMKSSCEIADWNNKTTSSVPHEGLHRKWAKLRKQHFGNLYEAQLRVLSAYVYKEEIVVTTTAQNRYGKTVYCRYFDCHRNELNGSVWKTFMFPLTAAFCVRRAGAVYMSLTDRPDGQLVSEPVPLTLRIGDKYEHELAVCVGPVYGNETRWLEIAETTEHHLLIGATFFYFTIFNTMNVYTRKLVDHYEKLGYFDVTVVQNEYKVVDWMSHMIQQNDCHFRARYHSKWIINVDIDERLVMLKYPIVPYLHSLPDSVGEIMVASRRVKRTGELPEKYEKEKVAGQLEFVKYNATSVYSYKVPKTIVRPEKIQAMFYHWSWAQYPGVKVISLSSEDGYIRHYRTVLASLGQHWYMRNEFKPTRLSRSFEERAVAAVTKRLEVVYGQRKIQCEEIRGYLLGLFVTNMYDCVWKNGTHYREVGQNPVL